ncbi:TetR/AcrR family transcriptional regulator [Micromonospora sp. CPCC 205711]|uniref:TetR/AcrR family transcriptional regulator n=1 Tax=Micromonospora sp. CPCC 205547 TaxID=3122400 RepID=UPI002FF1085F
MGNREALLAAAKRCLYQNGYPRTTARDIAAEAGVSLAAIGYHFKSTEALLNAALIDAVQDWGDEIARAVAEPPEEGQNALERFEATWTRLVDVVIRHRRTWVASFEFLAQVDHVPQVREQLAAGMEQARYGLARMLHDLDPVRDGAEAWAVGSFYQALVTGVMAQWLVDDERAPSGRELAQALESIMSTVVADVETSAQG